MTNRLKRVLVVDDEPAIVTLLSTILQDKGWTVTEARSGTEGIEKLESGQFDLILTDLMMPGESGLDLLRASKEIHPDVEVILMTGYATADTAIEAMRSGAFHYLVKPLRADDVVNLAVKAYEQRRLLRENQFLKSEIRGRHQVQSVVGDSEPIERLLLALQGMANADDPVLLVGERGSGRNFFARFVHFSSNRSAGLFVPVYCAGVPEDRLEADLFGQAPADGERHAVRRPGKMELANRGTLYLSDLGEAPPAVLDRLDRSLGAYPVAGGGDGTPDVRFVASAPGPLAGIANARNIPATLAKKLEAGSIRIPPLRERSGDVPLLLHHFLEEANRERKKALRGFTSAALEILESYAWPGNVRELRDLVGVIAAKKKQGTMIDASDIPPEIVYRRARKKDSPET
ncbi:MAG: sigma-54-dependent Fis family transcriptional regulator [Deltaproteobacteria bacterium]|nr:MAG: sigma-54-dependent Fis family transcriptional regulator [Deltaproteobacteria bacterium]